MAKLTMTQFKALTVDQQYSAYDDAMNLAANHQTANEDFAVRIGLADASKAELNATIAARDASIKAAGEQIATLTQNLADEASKVANMEGHPDVIAARKTAAIAKAQADKEAAVIAVAKFTKDLDDLSK